MGQEFFNTNFIFCLLTNSLYIVGLHGVLYCRYFSPLYIITDFQNPISHKNALFSLILLFVILLSSPQTVQLSTYTIFSIFVFLLSSIDIFAQKDKIYQ